MESKRFKNVPAVKFSFLHFTDPKKLRATVAILFSDDMDHSIISYSLVNPKDNLVKRLGAKKLADEHFQFTQKDKNLNMILL